MSLVELKSLYREGRLLPFIGAGISASIEWKDAEGRSCRGPSWGAMVEHATTLLGCEMPSLLRARGTDLQILEFFSLRFDGYTRLINWLVRTMVPPDDAIRDSRIHRELASMSECDMFYTTNYDDFIERGFALQGRAHHVVATEADMLRTRGSAEVVKFHGDWNNPSHMVMTESEYEKRMEFSTPLDLRLWSDLLNRTVLFIGYSFRDPNVAYLFRKVNERFRGLPNTASGRRAYIVVQEPSIFERKLFERRNIEVLPISGQRRADDIADLLERIRS